MAQPAVQPIPLFIPVRENWLRRAPREEILEPDLPIIDPHHHLWDRPGWRYMMPDLLADIETGHNIIGTVYVQARSFHRASGPEHMKALGESEFVNGVAAMSASGEYGPSRLCAGIVSHADFRIGAKVRETLEGHIAVAGGETGRFRGIRQSMPWVEDAALRSVPSDVPGLLLDKNFREGFAELAPLDLSYDTWMYHPQIPELTDLARAFPETRIVLDHVGGPLGISSYAGRRAEIFATWKASMTELAKCQNVCVKLGGLGMRMNGYDFHEHAAPPTSAALAEAWKPWIDTTIDLFGASRCMFESNFPVDKGSYGYAAFWNACKRLSSGASASEKADLFAGTAKRFYRIDL
jgi:predicted TIM-barrel fold metal-dependent hydrolase